MKKIIIISNYYKPENRPGVNRLSCWVENLYKHNYYPIIFCKNTLNESNKIVKCINYEIHYIDSNSLALKTKNIFKINAFKKLFSFLQHFLQFFYLFSPYKNVEIHINNFLKNNKIDGILASGPSFAIFSTASRVCKKNKLRWIADYRDDWSTTEIFSGIELYIRKSQSIIEKYFLKTASTFITVSPSYLTKIENILNIKGNIIENGFEELNNSNKIENICYEYLDKNKYNIVYPGTIYPNQHLNYINKVLYNLKPSILEKINFIFIGTQPNIIHNKLKVVNHNFHHLFKIYPRVDKFIADNIISNANAVLYIAHINKKNNAIKGMPSSKLYDYIKFKKNVLLMPSDSDFAEYKLSQAKISYKGLNEIDMSKTLTNLISNKDTNLVAQVPIDIYNLNKRESSVIFVANILNKYFK